jgi:hypothetical protein
VIGVLSLLFSLSLFLSFSQNTPTFTSTAQLTRKTLANDLFFVFVSGSSRRVPSIDFNENKNEFQNRLVILRDEIDKRPLNGKGRKTASGEANKQREQSSSD